MGSVSVMSEELAGTDAAEARQRLVMFTKKVKYLRNALERPSN